MIPFQEEIRDYVVERLTISRILARLDSKLIIECPPRKML